MSPSDHVIIHTDGACKGNPGPGGWGAILLYGDARKELKGGETPTTNNRMELMAAIKALEALTRPSVVDLHSDSQYLRDGISKWIHGWKRNGWKTADKKPVKNAELWQELDAQRLRHDVTFHWVKGHAGHELNERADELAREGMAPFKGRAVQDHAHGASFLRPGAANHFGPDSFVAKSRVKGRRSVFKRKGEDRLPIVEQMIPIEDKAIVFIEDEIFSEVETIFWQHFRRDLAARVRFQLGER